MAERKTIAVVGATGAQGGGLARAILEDANSPFHVRAITRTPKSEKAEALAKRGAEVVQADLDDVESLKRAFAGAYGAFCITNFWEHLSAEREIAQATNMAEAAKAAGIQHAIWSTLEDMRKWVPLSDDRMPTLQGKYKVPHFDAKDEANAEFAKRGVPTTFLVTSFYWDNMIRFGTGPKRGPDGKLALTMPMGSGRLPAIAVDDIGRVAYGIFKAGKEYIGKTVAIAGGKLTGQEMADALTKALGEEVRYNDVDPDVYRGFGFPGADEMGNMFQVKRDFIDAYCGARDIDLARKLDPELQSFEQWLAKHKHEIPLD